MPNGGSDCCLTCWFNRVNHGEAGYAHIMAEEAAYCEIRDLDVPDSAYTYCGNHPHRSPQRDPIPIGPVLVDPQGNGREIWKQSPDTEQVRSHLLDLLAGIQEQPKEEYPIGIYRDNLVVWQLGEFREQRAIHNLERIASFDPAASTGKPQPRRQTRHSLVQAAEEALRKIQGESLPRETQSSVSRQPWWQRLFTRPGRKCERPGR